MANVPIPVEQYPGQDIRLCIAAKNGYFKEIAKLIDQGIDINTQDGNGKTALIYASSMGFIDIVKLLLRYGADRSLKDNLGYDAYYSAMFHGDYKGVTLDPYDKILQMTNHESANT